MNKKRLDKKSLNMHYNVSASMDECKLILYILAVLQYAPLRIHSLIEIREGFRYICMYMYTPPPPFF